MKKWLSVMHAYMKAAGKNEQKREWRPADVRFVLDVLASAVEVTVDWHRECDETLSLSALWLLEPR